MAKQRFGLGKKNKPVAHKPEPVATPTPPRKPRTPPPPPPPSKITLARGLAAHYWGPQGGAANDFPVLAAELRKLKLTNTEMGELRDWLPIQASGVTGDKIKAVDHLLGRMERE